MNSPLESDDVPCLGSVRGGRRRLVCLSSSIETTEAEREDVPAHSLPELGVSEGRARPVFRGVCDHEMRTPRFRGRAPDMAAERRDGSVAVGRVRRSRCEAHAGASECRLLRQPSEKRPLLPDDADGRCLCLCREARLAGVDGAAAWRPIGESGEPECAPLSPLGALQSAGSARKRGVSDGAGAAGTVLP